MPTQPQSQVLPMSQPSAGVRISEPSAPRDKAAEHLRAAGVFVPVLMSSLALVAWLVLQGVQLWSERAQLQAALAGLEPQLQAATKSRASLDALAVSTARLAGEGNANARVIVEELRKRGITINTAAASSSQ
jgi:hypothetical protein